MKKNPEAIMRVADFFRTAPKSVQDYARNELSEDKGKNLTEALKICSHTYWLNMAVDKEKGLVKNQGIYIDYIHAFVPPAIRDDPENTRYFGSYALKDVDREQTLLHPDSVKFNMGVLRAMLGSPGDLEDDAARIVQGSLRARYRTPDGQRSAALAEDIRAVRELNPSAIGSKGIEAFLADDGGSLLRGAIQQGVLQPEDVLQVLGPGGRIEAKAIAHHRAVHLGHAQVERFGRVTERETRENAMTMADKFEELPGWQKLVLIGGLLYAGYKFKGAAIALGGLYFGAKFFAGIDDPLERLGKASKNLVRNSSVGKDYFRGVSPEDIQSRTALMTTFLDRHARGRLNPSISAFTIMGDVPMRVLSKYFSPDVGLRVNDPNFQREIRAVLKSRGFAPDAIENFLRNCTLRLDQLNHALANTFYLVALRRGADTERAQAQALQNAIDREPEGEDTMDCLLQKNPVIFVDGIGWPARTLFDRLVAHGCTVVNSSGDETLLQFVQSAVYANANFVNRRGQPKDKVPNVPAPDPGTVPSKPAKDAGKKPNTPTPDAGKKPDGSSSDPGSNPRNPNGGPGNGPNNPSKEPGKNPNKNAPDAGKQPTEKKEK